MLDPFRLYDMLMKQSSIGFCFFDTDLRCMLINGYLSALDGLSNQSHIGKSIEELLPTVWPLVKPYTDHVLKTSLPISGEVSGETPLLPGAKRYWNINLLPYTEEGILTGIVAIVNEVSGQKKKEQAIKEREELLAGINRILSAALICTTDRDLGLICLDVIKSITTSPFGCIGELKDGGNQNIAISNPGWSACESLSNGHVGGKYLNHGLFGRVLFDQKGMFTNEPANHLGDIDIPEKHPPITSFLCVPLISQDRVFGILAVANREGGYTAAEQSLLEALAPSIVEAFYRRRAKDELEAVNRELEQRVEQRTRELIHAEKLSAIGMLSASFAHEFNNPLQTVMTVLKSLSAGESREEEEGKLIQAAYNESVRMKNLIRSLQDFYRPSSGREELIDIHALLDSVLLLCRYDFNRKKISLVRYFTDDNHLLIAVPDQLKQVFLNLLNNAADACFADGGGITIRTWRNQDVFAVAVQDSGIGIKPEQLQRLFQPFYTTKTGGKGTGLGLSVCHGIVQSHGGTIRVESEPGGGSIFTVYLPIKGSQDPVRQ